MKKGQITVFIIVALSIVTIVALFFLFSSPIKSFYSGDSADPEEFFRSCMRDSIYDSISVLSNKGGYFENDLSFEFYFNSSIESQKVSYLCHTDEYFVPCTNLEPVLIRHLEENVEENIKEKVEFCFDSLGKSLDRRSSENELEYEDFEIMLSSGKIEVITNAELSWINKDGSANLQGFNPTYATKFYDLAILSQKIISQEIKNCEFDYPRFMLLERKFLIERTDMSDGTHIYKLADKNTKEEFKFATRGCVFNPGVFE